LDAAYTFTGLKERKNMKSYVKIPEINIGHMPALEESEQRSKPVPEMQKKV
jgi:hypothetical protein